MTEPSNPIQDQFGPCGILCGSCPLGSGTAAESASQTRKHIYDCQIPAWSHLVPGGEAIDWAAVDRALDWMTIYARCAGCHSGGGPPDCTIRICARERGYELCNSCPDLEGCTKFEWLRDYGQQVKDNLMQNRGLSREEYVRKMRSFK